MFLDGFRRCHPPKGLSILANHCTLPLIYGVSALDLLLSSERSSKHEVLAKHLMVWTISKKSTSLPDALFNAFIFRNNILHDGMRLPWSEKDIEKTLFRLYSFLDLTTLVILKSMCSNKKVFFKYLESESAKLKVKTNSIKWKEDVRRILQSSKLKVYKTQVGNVYNMWNEVIKKLPEDDS